MNGIFKMKKSILLLSLVFGLFGSAFANQIDNLKQGCDIGNGTSCSILGLRYSKGQGVKPDDFKAVMYWQKACGLDNGVGSFNLGLTYEYGQGVKPDDFKTVMYWQKACGLDNGVGSFNLGLMYEYGQGVR